jgi:hypothetical protein
MNTNFSYPGDLLPKNNKRFHNKNKHKSIYYLQLLISNYQLFNCTKESVTWTKFVDL